MNCPTHPHVTMIQVCPACLGAKGGKVVTPKKRAHLKRIAKLKRAGRQKPKPAAGPGAPE